MASIEKESSVFAFRLMLMTDLRRWKHVNYIANIDYGT
jgi:hypothetical protein